MQFVIPEFVGKYAFLSNTRPLEIMFHNRLFTTAENAFQWCKSNSPGCWESIERAVMYNIKLAQINKHEEFRRGLQELKDHYLMDGNYHHDNYWGVCLCTGCRDKDKQNQLGKIYMDIIKVL